MQFRDPSGEYNDYISEPIKPNNSGANDMGVIQVEVTTGNIVLEASVGGPFMPMQTFTHSGIYQITLPHTLRVTATGLTGPNRAWVVR